MAHIQSGNDLKSDIIGGFTTFLTMAYIVVVNPSIMSTAGTGLPFAGVMTATVLLSASMSIFMGAYAKLPFGVAPGMGLNAFLTFTVILGHQIPWPVAMGLIVWAGIIFLILSVLPVRVALVRAIPASLRAAAAMGIGLFLAFLGLKNAGLVVADPVTFVKAGAWTMESGLAVLGLLIMGILLQRSWRAAFLLGIGVVTLLGIVLGKIALPSTLISAPDFSSTFFKMDLFGSLRIEYLALIFTIMMTDLLDSISTLSGVAQATGLTNEKGEPKNLRQGLVVDAVATLSAGLFGTSTGTAFVESAAGIEAGGRTGRSAIVTGLCFLPCLFLAPLAAMVPAYATAPVLILVGAMMIKAGTTHLAAKKFEDAVPFFLTLALIPLTFSITQGLLWGLVSHALLYLTAGRAKEVSPITWVLALLSVALLILH